jgi:hypothetical protein
MTMPTMQPWPTSQPQERKRAFTVVIPLTLEHAKLAPTAIRMARLFLKHIVDRLHLLVVLGPNDTKAGAKVGAASHASPRADAHTP